MFSISFGKYLDEKKENKLFTLIIKILFIPLSCVTITSTARASAVFLLSFSKNLLVLYHDCYSLIGHATHYLCCDRW